MKKIDPVERLIANIQIDPEGCWLWTKGVSASGYGKIKAYGKTVYVHRLSYETYIGEIPAGFDVNHKCHSDNALSCSGGKCKHRLCANPEHLEAIDHSEHGSLSVHAQKSLCAHGHPLDYILPKGNGTRRGCRTCNRAAVRKYAQKRSGKP